MVLAILFFIALFGFKSFGEDVVDLNIGDTYYVIQPLHFIILFYVLLAIIIYPSRFLVYKFRNNAIADYIFTGFVMLIILAFTGIISINESLQTTTDLSQYPDNEVFKHILDKEYLITNTFNLIIIQLGLVLFLIYIIIRIQKKYCK